MKYLTQQEQSGYSIPDNGMDDVLCAAYPPTSHRPTPRRRRDLQGRFTKNLIKKIKKEDLEDATSRNSPILAASGTFRDG